MPDASIFALAAFLAVASLAVFALAYGWYDSKREQWYQDGWTDGWEAYSEVSKVLDT